jgi:hypothetical protein
MTTKALDLFQAYSQNKLPKGGGFIVSSFLDEGSTYSTYEVVGYNGVKSIFFSEEGLTFQTDGNKLFVVCEPPTYAQKSQEPFRRQLKEKIPHRFSELETLMTKNQIKVMVGKEPVLTFGSFTIPKPTGINFAFIFFHLPEVITTIGTFLEATLKKEAAVPADDAKRVAILVEKGLSRFTIWRDAGRA